jgi:hypothetical protein
MGSKRSSHPGGKSPPPQVRRTIKSKPGRGELIEKTIEGLKRVKEKEISGVLATNVDDVETQRIVDAFQGLNPPPATPTKETPKKNTGSATGINPYADNPRGEETGSVVDLSNALILDKVILCKFRFDENYIFSVERVELDSNEFNIKNFVAWSIKRCRYGENDEDMVADKTGKLVKRFAFSGKLASLPELHEAVYYLCLDSSIDTLISWDRAKQLKPDKFGVIDISTASRPTYSTKVYAFGPHRAYMDDVTYNNAVNQAIVYKALALTKWRNEKSRSKSKSDLDFFLLHIPARRMWHLLLAIELAMDLNNIKPKVPFTGGVIKREVEVEEDEEVGDGDGDDDDDDDDDEGSEEEAAGETTAAVGKKRPASPPAKKKKRDEQLVSDDELPIRKKRKVTTPYYVVEERHRQRLHPRRARRQPYAG